MSNDLTPENKKKIAFDCFRKGNEAMEKRNFDYAVKMHSTAVQMIPDSLLFRQTLRGCEQRMYNDNKSGAKLAGIRLTGVRNKIKKARSKSEWATMDQMAEEGLTLNPWDPYLNADLGDACFHLGYSEIAEFAYSTAVECDGERKQFLEKLAQVYELRGNYSGAIGCWKRIEKLEPNNGLTRQKITGLEAKAVMDRGGYEQAKSTQEVRRSAYDDYRPTTQKQAPESVSGPGMSLEADLQRAIRKTPADKGNYQKLAELYESQKDFAKAAEVLKQGLDVSGGDYNMRVLVEDNDLRRMKYELELARAAATKDESVQKQVDAMKRELHLREIEILVSRIERYPNNANYKYELATKYMKSTEYKKAIPLLQQATADSRREAEVLVALGKCFLAEKNNGLARRQFEKAVQKANPQENSELFCEANYILGRLCEQVGERDKAETHYNEVLSVNYAYKDARERLEKLQGEHGGRDAPSE